MPRQATQPSPKVATRPRAVKRGTVSGRHINVEEARARGLKDQWHDADTIDPDKPLTEKQKSLIQFFAAGESLTTATARAGYSNSPFYGHRLIKQPNARKLYDEEKAKYEAACHMTRKKVMDGLLEGVEMAKLAGEPASMIAGWREIGKMCGYYEPVTRKLDITINGAAVMDRMNRLSDQELLDLIQRDVTSAVVPALEE